MEGEGGRWWEGERENKVPPCSTLCGCALCAVPYVLCSVCSALCMLCALCYVCRLHVLTYTWIAPLPIFPRYPAAEMKHGPLALIDEFMPVVMICPRSDPTYQKTKANLEEVLARKGSVVLITEEDNTELDDTCEFVIKIPSCPEFLMPLLTVVPLQLISYFIADLRGCSIDQPRNLAKSVTVE